MISAQKAINLSMLKIGKSSSHVEHTIVDTAIKGFRSCEFPYEFIPEGKKKELEEAGFSVVLNEGIGEWEVIW